MTTSSPRHRSGLLDIHTREVGDVFVADLRGELRLGKESKLLGKLLRGEMDAGRKRILLQFTTLINMDSTGVGVLVEAKAHAIHLGGALRLCDCPSFVARILHRLALHKILDVYETEAEALANWR
jgi:anti-anti-sigma factor